MKVKSPKDFWAGLMFIGFGVAAMAISLTHYQFGTAVRMGPGYFPTVLGGLMASLGLVILIGSLSIPGPKVPKFNFRPLVLVLLGVLAYGYLMKPLGLVLATVALIAISALGGHEFKIKEVAILSVVMGAFSIGVFVKGLTLPFPLCPEAIDDACQSALNFNQPPPKPEVSPARAKRK